METEPPSSRPPSPVRHLAGLAVVMVMSLGLLGGCAEIHPETGFHSPPGHAR